MGHSDAEQPRGDAGASAVEYGLLFAAIVAAVMLSVLGFSHVVRSTFEQTATCIEHPEQGPDCRRSGVPATGGDDGDGGGVGGPPPGTP